MQEIRIPLPALTDNEVDAVRLLLMDAFGEFCVQRGFARNGAPSDYSVRNYVRQRYPYLTSAAEIDAKVTQVLFRCTLADKLHQAVGMLLDDVVQGEPEMVDTTCPARLHQHRCSFENPLHDGDHWDKRTGARWARGD